MFDYLSIILAAVIVLGGWWIWDDFRKVPLKEFGIEAMQRVLSFEPATYRIAVWQRGWMTRNEWRHLNKKQNVEITAELKRRGID